MAETGRYQREKNNTGGRDMTDYRLSTQAKSEKVTIMVGTFLKEETVKVPSTQAKSQKVTIMVGTFLKEETVKVPSTKTKAEKVDDTVTTFFERGVCESISIKKSLKRLPIWWEPFRMRAAIVFSR